MPTFDVHYKTVKPETGEVVTMSYFMNAVSWEEAEQRLPPTHYIFGKVLEVVDEETGMRINMDNLN